MGGWEDPLIFPKNFDLRRSNSEDVNDFENFFKSVGSVVSGVQRLVARLHGHPLTMNRTSATELAAQIPDAARVGNRRFSCFLAKFSQAHPGVWAFAKADPPFEYNCRTGRFEIHERQTETESSRRWSPKAKPDESNLLELIFLVDDLERELNQFAFNVIVNYTKATPIYLWSFPILKLQSTAGIVYLQT